MAKKLIFVFLDTRLLPIKSQILKWPPQSSRNFLKKIQDTTLKYTYQDILGIYFHLKSIVWGILGYGCRRELGHLSLGKFKIAQTPPPPTTVGDKNQTKKVDFLTQKFCKIAKYWRGRCPYLSYLRPSPPLSLLLKKNSIGVGSPPPPPSPPLRHVPKFCRVFQKSRLIYIYCVLNSSF